MHLKYFVCSFIQIYNRGRSNSIADMAFMLHMNDLSSILGIPYGPTSGGSQVISGSALDNHWGSYGNVGDQTQVQPRLAVCKTYALSLCYSARCGPKAKKVL